MCGGPTSRGIIVAGDAEKLPSEPQELLGGVGESKKGGKHTTYVDGAPLKNGQLGGAFNLKQEASEGRGQGACATPFPSHHHFKHLWLKRFAMIGYSNASSS